MGDWEAGVIEGFESIEDALEAFKKEASKPVRKPKQQVGEA